MQWFNISFLQANPAVGYEGAMQETWNFYCIFLNLNLTDVFSIKVERKLKIGYHVTGDESGSQFYILQFSFANNSSIKSLSIGEGPFSQVHAFKHKSLSFNCGRFSVSLFIGELTIWRHFLCRLLIDNRLRHNIVTGVCRSVIGIDSEGSNKWSSDLLNDNIKVSRRIKRPNRRSKVVLTRKSFILRPFQLKQK